MPRKTGGSPVRAEPLEPRTLLFWVGMESIALVESDDGTNAVFHLTANDLPAGETRRVNYRTRDGIGEHPAARAGEDYVPRAGEVVFGPGVTEAAVVVPVPGDTTVEGDEMFFLALSYFDGTVEHAPQALALVYEDDEADSIVTVGNAMEFESPRFGPERSLRFPVTLNRQLGPADDPLVLYYTYVSGTAELMEDVPMMVGGLTFAAGGESTKYLTLPIRYDTVFEANETVFLNIWGGFDPNQLPGYVDLLAQGVGVIRDRDSTGFPYWPVSINSRVVTDGDGGTRNAVFTVSMPALTHYPVFVEYETFDVTARAGEDYVATTGGQLVIPPMTFAATIEVPVIGDEVTEQQEAFGVRLTRVQNAGVERGSAVGTIVDDDVPRVVARHVFYNNSVFDGFDAGLSPADDGAVAADKSALLPGADVSFANVTSYHKGINGLMVDVEDLPPRLSRDVPQPHDYFSFRWGTSADRSTWQPGPPAAAVEVRRGAGAGGADRLSLVWPDYNPFIDAVNLAVANGWLEVTVLANQHTGLKTPDVFSFGNLIGETGFGNSATHLTTNATDLWMVRRQMFSRATVTNRFDINRDGRVGVADMSVMRWGVFQRLPLPQAGPVLASPVATHQRVAEQVLT